MIKILAERFESNKLKMPKLSKRFGYFKKSNVNKSLSESTSNRVLKLWIIYPQGEVKVIHTPIYGGMGEKICEIFTSGFFYLIESVWKKF